MTKFKRFCVSVLAVVVMACPGAVSYSYFLAFAAACGVPEFLGPIPLWPVFWVSVEGLAFVCLFAYWTTTNARRRIWTVLLACVGASVLVGFVHPLTHDPATANRYTFPWPWSGLGGMLPAICWPTALWLAHLVRQTDAPPPPIDLPPATVWARLGLAAGERLIGVVEGKPATGSPSAPQAPPQALIERSASAGGRRVTSAAASAREPASWARVRAAIERLEGEGVEPTNVAIAKRVKLSAVRVRAIRQEIARAGTGPVLAVAPAANGHGGA